MITEPKLEDRKEQHYVAVRTQAAVKHPRMNAGACEVNHLASGEPTRVIAKLASPSSDASIHLWAFEGH